jgi:phosphonopyruvate decarboxylase
MIAGVDVLRLLRSCGFHAFAGVPCSRLGGLFSALEQDREVTYVAAANEGAALAVAAGFQLAGRKSCVILQDSGLGNLLNPLTSLSTAYRVPALLIISVHEERDEPQHRTMAAVNEALLAHCGIVHARAPRDHQTLERSVAHLATIVARGDTAALLVEASTIAPAPRIEPPRAAGPLMTTETVIARLVDALDPEDAVIATTGLTGRKLMLQADSPRNFYMLGSMGHALAIGLGVALSSRPRRRVVVLDGDGAALMHLGSLSTVGHYAPAALLHVILDNGTYATTGGQTTTASTTSFADCATACGYAHAWSCATVEDLDQALRNRAAGPSLLWVKTATEAEPPVSVASRYRLPDIGRRFASHLAAAGRVSPQREHELVSARSE